MAELVPREDLGHGPRSLAQHDGRVRVVLLHRGVGARKEGPAAATHQIRDQFPMQFGRPMGHVCDCIDAAVVIAGGRPNVPDGGALLGGLAEEEADLPQGLGKGVLARHLRGDRDERCDVEAGSGGDQLIVVVVERASEAAAGIARNRMGIEPSTEA